MDITRENYGIDAPTVVRNFVIIGVVLAVASLSTALLVDFGKVAPSGMTRLLIGNGGVTGAVCLIMAFWMFASSRWLKQKVARALLDMHAWRGDEAVLDIGCGRGLVAVTAARRVPA